MKQHKIYLTKLIKIHYKHKTNQNCKNSSGEYKEWINSNDFNSFLEFKAIHFLCFLASDNMEEKKYNHESPKLESRKTFALKHILFMIFQNTQKK